MSFAGFADAGDDVVLFVLTAEAGAPVDPDAAPTFRLFGRDGAVAGGTGTCAPAESGAVTGATNATPVAVTSAAHGLPTGAYVTVSGVGGNTAANGDWFVTSTGANTFTLDDSVGNGAYTSGGAWKSLGLWTATLTGAVLSALEPGQTYTVLVTWEVTGDPRQTTLTFTVQ